jgi:penicillin-binding protein 4
MTTNQGNRNSNNQRITSTNRTNNNKRTTSANRTSNRSSSSSSQRVNSVNGQRTQSNNHNTGNSSHKNKKKNKKFKKKVFWGVLISFLLVSLIVLLGSFLVYMKYGKEIEAYQKEARELVNQSDLETFRQSETSLVYDANKKLISTLKGEKDVYYLSYEDIPEYAKEAMISIEDKKFSNHEGVDLLANVRAVVAFIKHKGKVTQGASTITQQLARNIFLSNEVSVERKLKEIFIAVELEKKYSKKLILEFYLNNIYFANGYYGIEAASKGYFNKKVGKLSLSQIAYLCAIPNNPTIYDPFDYPDSTIKRRDRILKQMLKDGYIGEEDYQTAINEEMELVQKKVSKNNYVATYVFYTATRALMEQQGFKFRNEFKDEDDKQQYEAAYNELYNQCQKSLYYEGYRIYTSIDLKVQKKLQKAVDDALSGNTEKNKNGVYKFQGAAVSIDNSTGRVVAIVGGRSQESSGYTLNRAYQSFRQPGSAIKPLIVYTPIFQNGYYPDDIVVDEKFKDGPSNSNGKYDGKITIRKAVEVSKNTIAWKMFEELTPKVGLSYLLNMGFSKIDKNDYYPAVSLGGFTTGTSPLEMTSAFATIENDGIYREPTCIIKILDSKGNVIVGDEIKDKRIYETNAARMMTDVLTGVMKNGTGKGLVLDHMVSAGKTGTTNQKKDGWFVGFTPYYTTGVWVGYDIPQEVSGLSGATYPGTIWKQFMNDIHVDLESKSFTPFKDKRPPKVTEAPTPTPTVIETPDDTNENSEDTDVGEDDTTIDESDNQDMDESLDDNLDDGTGENQTDDGWVDENDNTIDDGTNIDPEGETTDGTGSNQEGNLPGVPNEDGLDSGTDDGWTDLN